MTNYSNTALYIGVTDDIIRRVNEHKEGKSKMGFTSRYKIVKLVYYEATKYILNAIEREKQLKAGSRQKKINLINGINPRWEDLYESLF